MNDATHPETLLAKAGDFLDVTSGALTPPIVTSTTFARDDRYQPLDEAQVYARDDNPTFVHAEQVLARLEGGEEALLFASGMAAVAAVFYTLETGAVVALPQSMYWGVYSWTRQYCARVGIEITYYDPADALSVNGALEAHARADLVWIETPSNPMMHVTDIAAVADIAHARDALVVVDNTTPTPVFTQPLDHGADLVMHSATKSLNGHSDVLAGALVTRERHAHWQRIVAERHEAGAVISPFDAWLLLRGMRTLCIRVAAAAANAERIAAHLDAHANVERVLYPGLSSHPGHSIACRQMNGGFGSLLSFQVRGGRDAALAVAGHLQLIVSATSLGGVETLIEHRHSVEPPETEVPENLLRLAVGIEHIDDLLSDLDLALAQIR